VSSSSCLSLSKPEAVDLIAKITDCLYNHIIT
jgi:hypothetical protein